MSNTATARQFKILGICDNVNACDCCGKSDLQKTVAIENAETGVIGYFGTSCAMQPSKCFGFDKKEMNSALRDFKADQEIMWWKSRRIYKERGGKMEEYKTGKILSHGFPETAWRYADQALIESIRAELGPIKTI